MKLNKAYKIYFLEFFIRLVYSIFSYILCWIIFFNNIKLLFLFETLPIFIVLIKKRFIFTELTQLFNIIIFYISFFTFIFIFPLIIYHVSYYMSSCWYSYQIKLYSILIKIFCKIFTFIFFFSHFILVPALINFFLYWEITDEYSIIQIESELSLFYYIIWSFIFKFNVSILISLLGILFKIIFYFLNIIHLQKFVLQYKKLIIFNLVFFFFLIIPPDLFLQFILILFSFLFVELVYLIICIKFQNNIKNKILSFYAYNKTITESIQKNKKKF